MQTFRKVYGWFIRRIQGEAQLLIFTAPEGSFRFPSRTVEENEELLHGLQRELREETGITDFKVLRKLGVHAYYKPDVRKYVERHDYLLQASSPLPDSFSFKVQSDDKDNGMLFDYYWMSLEEFDQLDWEFKKSMTAEYIPEVFLLRGDG
jgi:8-oxo-dGTP pyrophosphatase MutT (NUDIX family)